MNPLSLQDILAVIVVGGVVAGVVAIVIVALHFA